jgi:hypothetical protein
VLASSNRGLVQMLAKNAVLASSGRIQAQLQTNAFNVQPIL